MSIKKSDLTTAEVNAQSDKTLSGMRVNQLMDM